MPAAALSDVSPGRFLVALVIDAGLSLWVYWHASRHGSRHATAWGLAAFFVWPVVVYLAHYYATRRRF
jgi:hypothetical protein